MASAQQLIGLVKSHAEGNSERFFDLAMQLAAIEEQKGHKTLAEQLRQWAEAGNVPKHISARIPTPIVAPRGELSDILRASYPATRLVDLVLPSGLQHELSTLVKESKSVEQLEEKGISPRRHILLAGPPGTGKTLTASALAGELKYPLFTVLLHGLISKFMGETAQKLRLIFDAILTNRGVYLFDEIDALAATRNTSNDVGEARRVLNSFLQFLDDKAGPSIVVATTNVPQILDHAILRRFDVVLQYKLPDDQAIRLAMQRRLVDFKLTEVNWTLVIKAARGLSTADIVVAAEGAARNLVLNGAHKIVTSDLVTAIHHRHALQHIGAEFGTMKPKALSVARKRKEPPVPKKSGRRKQGTK